MIIPILPNPIKSESIFISRNNFTVDERFARCMCVGLTIDFVNKLPEDSVLVLKHVALTIRSVFYDLLYCIVNSEFCWFKVWNTLLRLSRTL